MFESIKGHLKFALAPQFYKNGALYTYDKTLIEKVGHFLRIPLGVPFEIGLRNIKNPLAITALTLGLGSLIAIAFYSFPAMLALGVEPWMIKFAIFLILQVTILGLGVRAYGRFDNSALYQDWRNKAIQPVFTPK